MPTLTSLRPNNCWVLRERIWIVCRFSRSRNRVCADGKLLRQQHCTCFCKRNARMKARDINGVHEHPYKRVCRALTENRLSKFGGRPLGLCGQRFPELNFIPVRVIDPGKATVGFVHSFGVNFYALLF